MASRLELHSELFDIRRLELHSELIDILGTSTLDDTRVYFQPPESLKMKYPCIRYSKSGLDQKKANNRNYKVTNQYEIIVIDPNPDSDIPDKILEHFEMCQFDRAYPSNNLNHFVLTLFY